MRYQKGKNVALTTLYHRARGRRSKEEKDEDQQYLTRSEEKAVVKFYYTCLLLDNLCE